ncbi:hypothetical protein DERP_001495, partial [Dermatophagoides pteronyssinus]
RAMRYNQNSISIKTKQKITFFMFKLKSDLFLICNTIEFIIKSVKQVKTRKKGKNFEIYFNETKLPKEFRYINITDEKFLAGQLYDGDEISER